MTVGRLVRAVETALLTRFEALPEAPRWLIDRAMSDVIVPFNERTSSPSAIVLPRGSTIWLDAYSRGMPAMNNVGSSDLEIQRMCPELIEYYRGGARASVYELAILHAAARAHEVVIRGDGLVRFERQTGESAAGFLARLRTGEGEALAELDADRPLTAILLHGDVELPPGSPRYVVIRGTVSSTMAPSDLLSAAADPPSTASESS